MINFLNPITFMGENKKNARKVLFSVSNRIEILTKNKIVKKGLFFLLFVCKVYFYVGNVI